MKPSYVVRLLLDKYDYVPREKIESRLEGSSFVNLDKRYLYFAIGKSGCTTMKTLLHRIEGAPPIKIICDGWDESRRDMFIHARENVPLPSLLDLNDAMQREVIHSPDFLRMTVVRNPYTRVLSAWRKIMLCEPGAERQYLAIKGALPRGPKKELITVREFVDYLATEDLRTCDGHWRLQVESAFMDVMNFNLIGRVENMAEATDRFFRHIGYSTDTVVERRNESGASSVGEYDQELADRVRALYAEDFRRLDYNADDWPAGKAATQPFVSEEKFWDEIVERNLLLSALYREAQRLKAEKDRLDRFHMLKLTSGLSAIRAIARKSALALSRVR